LRKLAGTLGRFLQAYKEKSASLQAKSASLQQASKLAGSCMQACIKPVSLRVDVCKLALSEQACEVTKYRVSASLQACKLADNL